MTSKTALSSKHFEDENLPKREVRRLRDIARRVRIDIIKMLAEAGSGHPGGSLSATDILVALYFHVMNHKPSDPDWKGRDRFVLSKGHAAPALYAVLAEAGYFDKSELMTLRKYGSKLQGHPDRILTRGVEMSTGSLGQGLSVSCGMALGAKIDKKNIRIFTLCSDGEHQSGMTWEAVLFASSRKLDNLTVLIDNNHLQIDGCTDDIVSVMPLRDKYLGANWNVLEADGHDFDSIISAINKAVIYKGKPTVIICDTVKGKGISFMEDQVSWHGVTPKQDEAEKAIKELENMEIE